MSLAGVKVGDAVMVTDVNRKEPQREKVTAIGRKYAEIGGRKYDLTTGRWANKDFGSHRNAYTMAAWARRSAEKTLRDVAAVVSEDLRWRCARLTDDEIREATATLQALAAKLRGEEKTK